MVLAIQRGGHEVPSERRVAVAPPFGRVSRAFIVSTGLSVVPSVIHAAVASATTTNVLTVPASASLSLQGAVTSPTGVWQMLAVQATSGAGGTSFRLTQDGSSPISIPSLRVASAVLAFDVSDAGAVVALVTSATGNTDAYRYVSGVWLGRVNFGVRPPWAMTESTSGKLIAVLHYGEVYTSTDGGATWTVQGSIAAAWAPLGTMNQAVGRISAIGNDVYDVIADPSASIFVRWNIVTGLLDQPTTPPVLDGSLSSPDLFSLPGSTSEIWIAERPGGSAATGFASSNQVSLFRSVDFGATWVSVVRGDPYPADFPMSSQTILSYSSNVTIGADRRLTRKCRHRIRQELRSMRSVAARQHCQIGRTSRFNVL